MVLGTVPVNVGITQEEQAVYSSVVKIEPQLS